MKKLEQIPNPFPSLGTPASIGLKIKPIGYNKGIDRIHYTIRHNTGHQAMIFNIVGDFGYGKTLFLNYLYDYYSHDYVCETYNLTKFEKLGPFFLEKIKAFNEKYKDEKDGIIFFIDETQNIFLEEKKKEKNAFLDFLRDFPDGKLENKNGQKVDISDDLQKIIVFFALHRETAQLVYRDRQDIGDRCLTQRLDLVELDYYSAHKIIKTYMSQYEYNYLEWFDKSIINCIYCLTPFITHQRHILKQKNPRIFLEIFFQLFEYIRELSDRYLDRKKLIEILSSKTISIGSVSDKSNKAILKLHDEELFKKIFNNIKEHDKEIVESYLFNPIWNLIEDKEKKILRRYLNYFDIRSGFIIESNEFSDLLKHKFEAKIRDLIRNIPVVRIFKDINKSDEAFIIFDDDLYGIKDNTLKETFHLKSFKKGSFCRLRNEFLESLFFYNDAKVASGLYEYLKQKKKSDYFFKVILKDYKSPNPINNNFFKNQKDLTFKNHLGDNTKMGYYSLKLILFPFLDNFEQFNIYFIEDSDIDDIKSILNNINEKQLNNESICEIIILEPYIELHDFKLDLSVDKNYINKIKIFHPNNNEFADLIGYDSNRRNEIINSYFMESRQTSIKELIEKGFLIPLTNIKVQNKQNYKMFKDLVTKNFEYEEQNIFTLTNPDIGSDFSSIKDFLVHTDNFGVERGKKTLKIFFQCEKSESLPNNYKFIPKVSVPEMNYLVELEKLIKNNYNEPINQDIFKKEIGKIIPASQRKYCDFFGLITEILICKKIIKIQDKKIRLIHPKQNLEDIISFLDLIILFDLDEREKIKYRNISNTLRDDFLTDSSLNLTYEALILNNSVTNYKEVANILDKFSFYNYICEKLHNNLQERFIRLDNEINLKLMENLVLIHRNFSETINIVNLTTSEESSIEVKKIHMHYFKKFSVLVRELLEKIENKEIFNFSFKTQYSTDILQFMNLLFLYLSYYKEENIDTFLKSSNGEIFNSIYKRGLELNQDTEFINQINSFTTTEENINIKKIIQDITLINKFLEVSYEFHENRIEDQTLQDYIEENYNISEEKNWRTALISKNLSLQYSNLITLYNTHLKTEIKKFKELGIRLTKTLKKIYEYCNIEKESKLTEYYNLYLLNLLKNRKLIKVDEKLAQLFSHVNYYVFFSYNNEFNLLIRLLKNNLDLTNFYLKFVDHYLTLAYQEDKYLELFKSQCSLIDESSSLLCQIYNEILKLIPQKDKNILSDFKVSNLFKFVLILLFLQNNDISRKFIYFYLNYESSEEPTKIIMNIPEDLNKIYYEKGFFNKEIVSKYEFDIKTGEDKEIDNFVKYELNDIDLILKLYIDIFKKSNNEIYLINEYNSLENYIPKYNIFEEIDEKLENSKKFCPLGFIDQKYKVEFFKKEKIEISFNNLISDIKSPQKLCLFEEILESSTKLIEEKFIDNRKNYISPYFSHPLIEMKSLIDSNSFGVSKDKKNLINLFLKKSINKQDLIDISEDFIHSNRKLEKCFEKTQEFLNQLNDTELTQFKNFTSKFSNNIEELKKIIKSN